MNEQTHAGGQAHQDAEIMITLILDRLALNERKEWEYLQRVEAALGKECTEYGRQLARWSTAYDSYQLVRNILNNQ